MSLSVVGSIAFDTIETPFGKRERVLGGAAVHFALASSFFVDTHVVGPVGDDFGDDEYAVLRRRGIDTGDIEQVPGGTTFSWSGRYERDLNIRHTMVTELNVFDGWVPKLSFKTRHADAIFLANIQPKLQLEVRNQCNHARFSALDSMSYWINYARDELTEAIGKVDCLILADDEIKELTDEPNLIRSAQAVLELGPRYVIAKHGEYGAAMITRKGYFALPAYPTRDVIDPTGAGDSFAGGIMGFIAAHQTQELSDELLRRAMAYGTVLASFNVEAFGSERLQTVTPDEINHRVAELQRITRFDHSPVPIR